MHKYISRNFVLSNANTVHSLLPLDLKTSFFQTFENRLYRSFTPTPIHLSMKLSLISLSSHQWYLADFSSNDKTYSDFGKNYEFPNSISFLLSKIYISGSISYTFTFQKGFKCSKLQNSPNRFNNPAIQNF